jgi:hypothetical protein
MMMTFALDSTYYLFLNTANAMAAQVTFYTYKEKIMKIRAA